MPLDDWSGTLKKMPSAASFSSQQDNFQPGGATVWRKSDVILLDPTSVVVDITGFIAPASSPAGDFALTKYIYNVAASKDFSLIPETTSIAANRILTPGGGEVRVASSDGMVIIQYDFDASRWRVIGGNWWQDRMVANSMFIRLANGDLAGEIIALGEMVGRSEGASDIRSLSPADVHSLLTETTAHGVVLSPAQITSNQAAYNPTDFDVARIVRLTSDASRDIQGIDFSTASVFRKRLYNVGSFDIVLKHQDAAAADEDKLLCFAGTDITLTPDDNVEIWYDDVTNRWRVG